jgi:hypothetical protein
MTKLTVAFGDFATQPKMLTYFNPLNSELNPIRHLLSLAGARHFVDFNRISFPAFPKEHFFARFSF